MTTRARVSSATVYVDAVAGSDVNDGTTPATALLTIQRALDYASGNFDLAPPYSWASPIEVDAVAYRAGITIQMAPNPSTSPFLLPDPAMLDGLGCSGPITLLGDPASPMSYCIRATNSLQGLAPQNGATLICRGFRIWGDADCTLINPISGGRAVIDTVVLGGGGKGGAVGAAGGSKVYLIGGGMSLVGGSGFVSIFEAIEQSQINLGAPININNTMNFGVMCVASHSEITAQNIMPSWGGAGLATSTGSKYTAVRAAYIGFDHTLIPGSAGYCDATSTVA